LSPETLAPSIRECLVNFDFLESHPDWFQVDWVFCALGTTLRQAGSREAFWHVDFDYPLAIAQPSLLLGERSPPRLGEEIGKRLAWLFPSHWRPVQASQVAGALLRAAQADEPG